MGATSLACTCDFNLADVESNFDQASLVFRARVIAVDHVPYYTTLSDGRKGKATLVRAEVEIEATFKGDTSELVYVATDSSTCGLNIVEGDDYVFFATDLARVHLCGGSLAARNSSAYGVGWSEYVGQVARLGDSKLAP